MKKFVYILAGLLLVGSGYIVANILSGESAVVRVKRMVAAPARMAERAMSYEASEDYAPESGNSTGRMISYLTKVELNVRDLNAARKTVSGYVEKLGGYVAEENKKYLDVYVPARDLDAFVEFLEHEVGEITDQSKRGRDVTDSYGDNMAELTVALASRNQYMSLMKRAEKVADILSIEKELERVNTKILRLEQQKKRTERSVELSNVEIRMEEVSFWDKITPAAWAAFTGLFAAALFVGGIKFLKKSSKGGRAARKTKG